MRKHERERDLQAAICVFLRSALPKPDATFFAVPNGMHAHPRHVEGMKKTGLTPGVADIIIIFRSKVIAVELKTARTRQSDAQLAWARDATGAGASYYIVRSLAEMELVLTAEGIATKASIAA